MKGSWIYWFLLITDLSFIGLIGYFGQDRFSPEQSWYAFATLLLYRIIALWIALIGLARFPVNLKKWELWCFCMYVLVLCTHSVWWSIQITNVIWPQS